MVRYQAPCKQLPFALDQSLSKPPEKFLPVLFVPEDLSAFYAASHHMPQDIWHVQPSTSRHADTLNYL